jgi:hypothetical protein
MLFFVSVIKFEEICYTHGKIYQEIHQILLDVHQGVHKLQVTARITQFHT